MKSIALLALGVLLPAPFTCNGAPVVTTHQGEEGDLPFTFSNDDLIQGLIPVELPGDRGWHPANTDPGDQLAAFTDGAGLRASGLTGLLSDFPGEATPTKRIQYSLPHPAEIERIRVFSGNNGRDGRVFHTHTVAFSSDGGATYSAPFYVQSHPSGTLNTAQVNQWRVVVSDLADDSGTLASGVTDLRMEFYAVDNTGGQMRDAFNGMNPFSGTDDGLAAAFVSPLIWEIDVIGRASPPRLTAHATTNGVRLTWRSPETNHVLQSREGIDVETGWNDVLPMPPVTRAGLENAVDVALEGEARYFRLRQ